MKRRDFLKTGFYSAALTGSGVNLLLPSKSLAAHPNVVPKTLVNVLLQGGADMRFALAPRPDHDAVYIEKYWTARKSLYSPKYASYAEMYAAEYLDIKPTVGSNVTVKTPFGVHKSCGWLLQKFNAGDVAIVANVFGSENRRHDHSMLIINSGDSTIDNLDFRHEGWGGRLVEAISQTPNANAVSVSEHVSMFVKGTAPGNPLAQVIHAKDMRKMALPTVNVDIPATDSKNITRRALKAYYDARGGEIDAEKAATWPYRKFFKHYESINNFGSQINDTLLLPEHTLPSALLKLNLNDDGFTQQCRNVYDTCLTAEILGSRVLSMIRGGWDTHKNQETLINDNLQDVFGFIGGLATLSAALDDGTTGITGANDNLLYYFSSDFGRQLAANGDLGTDHGVASYSIIIGSDVNGGVYGDMFPQSEAQADPTNGALTPFEIPGSDVKGLTSFEYVCSEICDWVQPGTGSLVFQNPPVDRLESGVVLSDLFRNA